MRGPVCAVAAFLPEVSGGRLAAHRESCRRCRADDARRRSLERELAALGAELAPAPPALHASVMARIGLQDSADPRRALAARAVARHAAAAGVAVLLLAAWLAGLARRRSRATA